MDREDSNIFCDSENKRNTMSWTSSLLWKSLKIYVVYLVSWRYSGKRAAGQVWGGRDCWKSEKMNFLECWQLNGKYDPFRSQHVEPWRAGGRPGGGRGGQCYKMSFAFYNSSTIRIWEHTGWYLRICIGPRAQSGRKAYAKNWRKLHCV